MENKSVFFKEDWKDNDPDGLRQWMINKYNDFINSFPWNKEQSVQIVPMVHGTSFKIAMSICSTGFTTLASLDEGWYAKGIYLTSSSVYATPYFATKPEPALIIAYIIPGNTFPVTENPTGPSKLVGTPLKTGYQSHYVVTTSSGLPVKTPSQNCFDELVINQEAQVVPAFILKLDISNLNEVLENFNRSIPQK